MIEVRIQKRLGPHQEAAGFALDVAFSLSACTTVVFGPSGSGKTTLLECISGLVRPDRGRIVAEERVLFDDEAGIDLPARERGCGYVFQEPSLFPHLSVRRNLAFGCPDVSRVSALLGQFRLAGLAERMPHQLSGGQRQRATIARALANAPRLLLLDEPSRGLDAILREELYDVLGQVQREFHIPLLLVTHDVEEALALGDEMLVLADGRVVQQGSPRAVVEGPVNPSVARLVRRSYDDHPRRT